MIVKIAGILQGDSTEPPEGPARWKTVAKESELVPGTRIWRKLGGKESPYWILVCTEEERKEREAWTTEIGRRMEEEIQRRLQEQSTSAE